jgi:hypothetical protein
MPAGVSAYTALANVTLGSSASTVTFSSISQAFRDLIIVMSPMAVVNGGQPFLRINSDSGANYSSVYAEGDGSSTNSGGSVSPNSIYLTRTYYLVSDTKRSSMVINLLDYSVTNKHKTVLFRGNQVDSGVGMGVGRWASTSAITSIEITGNGTFASGSTFALYGVSA